MNKLIFLTVVLFMAAYSGFSQELSKEFGKISIIDMDYQSDDTSTYFTPQLGWKKLDESREMLDGLTEIIDRHKARVANYDSHAIQMVNQATNMATSQRTKDVSLTASSDGGHTYPSAKERTAEQPGAEVWAHSNKASGDRSVPVQSYSVKRPSRSPVGSLSMSLPNLHQTCPVGSATKETLLAQRRTEASMETRMRAVRLLQNRGNSKEQIESEKLHIKHLIAGRKVGHLHH